MTRDRRRATTIRPATVEDARRIARLHVDSWRSTYRGIVPDSILESLDLEERTEIWRREMTDSTRDQFVFVAVAEDDEVVGFVSGGPERSGDYPEYTGELYAIYVHDTWHGFGIGRALVETGTHELVRRGQRSMLIWALSANPACDFYRHLGGELIATQTITAGQKRLEESAFGWKNILMISDKIGPEQST
jgi:GNAT superfamily N-acetyltransferase